MPLCRHTLLLIESRDKCFRGWDTANANSIRTGKIHPDERVTQTTLQPTVATAESSGHAPDNVHIPDDSGTDNRSDDHIYVVGHRPPADHNDTDEVQRYECCEKRSGR
ncbi:MAG: hypothetical protein C5S47_03110 [Candidatus Methanogasteraceae archaeon]|nr:MAG: hypothetical protein C5S47_03110 [ANME-2 cluster archaeon]